MEFRNNQLAKYAVVSAGIALICSCWSANAGPNTHLQAPLTQQVIAKKSPKIQIAIMLDTSSSMNGLIDQAKSRLWSIINTISTLKFDGKTPIIEIAVYEYGHSRLDATKGYVLNATPFTTDLDLVSEVLFGLRTGGGLELCGEVIQTSINQLKWDDNKDAMKLIYIAGNEAFDQLGVNKVSYVSAISHAVERGVYVNTIHCGTNAEGVNGYWKAGADLGLGKYFNIDHNQKIQYVATPYDAELEQMNTQLNATYYGYGKYGMENKSKQIAQDNNAQTMDKAVYAERSVFKAKAQYNNASWDIVDAYEQDKGFAAKVDKGTLPSEFRNLDKQELEKKIIQISSERKKLQERIATISKEREAYTQQQNTANGSVTDDLGSAITNSIIEFAKKKNYSYHP